MKYCMLILVVVGVCLLPYTAFAGCQIVNIVQPDGSFKVCTVCTMGNTVTSIQCSGGLSQLPQLPY